MTTAPLILSLFPGIGLLDMAFEAEGFCVVRGPPCQMFSRARGGAAPVYGDLIPEFERVVSEASPAWFLMENVPEAPVPSVPGYAVDDRLIRDVWVGGLTRRLRRFSCGTPGG